MNSTAVSTEPQGTTWGGGNQPLKSSYGKMMMWFFIVSDALTFSGFLAAYGFSRFKYIDYWPIADEVFTHVPFLHGQELPMIYVAFMTFILIMSSVTMVMAVDAGHKMQKAKVTFYMFLTIIGGIIFVGSQAWEWATFIKGDYGAVKTKGGNILQFLDAETSKRVSVDDFAFEFSSVRNQHQSYNGIWYDNEGTLPTYNIDEVIAGFEANPNILIRKQILDENGHKTILSREESLNVLKETGVSVVNGCLLYTSDAADE